MFDDFFMFDKPPNQRKNGAWKAPRRLGHKVQQPFFGAGQTGKDFFLEFLAMDLLGTPTPTCFLQLGCWVLPHCMKTQENLQQMLLRRGIPWQLSLSAHVVALEPAIPFSKTKKNHNISFSSQCDMNFLHNFISADY